MKTHKREEQTHVSLPHNAWHVVNFRILWLLDKLHNDFLVLQQLLRARYWSSTAECKSNLESVPRSGRILQVQSGELHRDRILAELHCTYSRKLRHTRWGSEGTCFAHVDPEQRSEQRLMVHFERSTVGRDMHDRAAQFLSREHKVRQVARAHALERPRLRDCEHSRLSKAASQEQAH